ncbi:hypothetical protein BDZ45DRAFT_810990 [Acephala macrosclerotiorum]|nr:hypothetical protein BDZ45DRAFT_810990 [Acephala macrosclerotiorum]
MLRPLRRVRYVVPDLASDSHVSRVATSVWAAVAKDLEGKGGKFLESMQEIGFWTRPEEKSVDWTDSEYAPYAYNDEKENKLWELSENLIKYSSSSF